VLRYEAESFGCSVVSPKLRTNLRFVFLLSSENANRRFGVLWVGEFRFVVMLALGIGDVSKRCLLVFSIKLKRISAVS